MRISAVAMEFISPLKFVRKEWGRSDQQMGSGVVFELFGSQP